MNKIEPSCISIVLSDNLRMVKEQFHSSDLKIRTFNIGGECRESAIIFLDGITNIENVQENIFKPLIQLKKIESIESVVSNNLYVLDVTITTKFDDTLTGLSKGQTLILIDGFHKGILADSSDWQKKAVSEPIAERSAKGPSIGFNELLKVNVNLIRNMVQSQKLTIELLQVGSIVKTEVAILSMDGLVDQKALEETRKKIRNIDVKYLLESRVIEDSLEERKTLFPLVLTTERPDTTVSALLQGRVVILINGTPYTLIVPCLFIDYLQHPDEFYSKAGRFTHRLIRLFSWFLAITLVGFYATMVRFHQNWLPQQFVKDLLETKVLFPFWLELFFLTFLVLLLVEGSLRLPKSTVVLVSLIGAIVVGETSVSAKLVHSLTLVVVGVDFLATMSLLIGGLWGSILALRILFILAGYFFGVKGMIIGLTLLIIYMTSLKSTGVPFLAPLIPFRVNEIKDVFIRGDIRKLINRDHTYPHKEMR